MDIVRPQLYHVGRPDSMITEFVSNCRFGQTEIGSYVVSIICPISNINNSHVQHFSLFDNKEECANSFTRNVINRLITSVNIVRSSIDQGVFDKRLHQEPHSQNFISANFLDALSGINIYRNNSRLDITAKYAPTIRGNMLPNASATISHDYYEPINSIVKKIKNSQEREKKFIIGRIKKLDAAPDPTVRKDGNVTIVFLDDAQKKSTVSATLSKSDYNAAIEAHRDGNVVKVVGTISGLKNKKIDCRHFEILQ